MSKKVNKTMIGVFVVVALVLLMIGIVVFGSGELFKRTNKFVLYFDGSVKGLSIGAPVMFRGVSIGTVKDISLIYDAKGRDDHASCHCRDRTGPH
jgi:paraquat-inducible protein B